MPRPGHSRLGALGGPTPIDFFSPHSTVHSPGFQTWQLSARNHSGAAHMHFLHTHNTHKLSGIQHPDPCKLIGGQTMVFDHLSFCCVLQPLAPNTFKPRRSGASLGQTVQRARIFFASSHNIQKFSQQNQKANAKMFSKNLGEMKNGAKTKYEHKFKHN